MVSEKVVVALIIVAIILSVVSIAVTVSTVNTKLIPKIQPASVGGQDSSSGRVSIIVNKLPEEG